MKCFKIKKAYFLLFVFFSQLAFAQFAHPYDSNRSGLLNDEELKYFNKIFQESDSTFNLKSQRIIFVANNSKPKSISKNEFLETYINPSKKNNKTPNFSIISLSKDEKEKSGQYDLIFLAPSGILNTKQRDKIFKQLWDERLYEKKTQTPE